MKLGGNLVLEGTRDQVQRDLLAAQRRGDVVDEPTLVKRLDGGRYRVIVPARGIPPAPESAPRLPRERNGAPWLGRRRALGIGATAAGLVLAGTCYGAGLAGWGIGVVKAAAVALLVLVIATVVVAVVVAELRGRG